MVMEQNKRDPEHQQWKPQGGNQQPSGTGTHARHGVDQARADADRKAEGTAGRQPCRVFHISMSRSAVQMRGSTTPLASSKQRVMLKGWQCSKMTQEPYFGWSLL